MNKVNIPKVEIIDQMATKLKGEVTNLPKDAELVFISFQTTTRFQEDLGEVRKKLKDGERNRKIVIFRSPKEKFVAEKGGKVTLFWISGSKLKPIWEYDCSFASAINVNAYGLHLGFLKKIITIKGNDFIVRTHPWFNHVHSIENSSEGNMLITSSGLDLILEISALPTKDKPTFAWWATDYGFSSMNPKMKKKLSKSKDYRTKLFGVYDQATHINSAIETKDKNIIATLFHQGEIIKIDRETGNYKILVGDLKKPHFVRKIRGGFIVCDTGNHRILLFNNEFRIREEINLGCEWIQDAWLSFDGRLMWVLDCNNTRVVKIDLTTKKEVASYKYDLNYRGFQIYPVKNRNWLINHL